MRTKNVHLDYVGTYIKSQREQGDWREIGGQVNCITGLSYPKRDTIRQSNGKHFPTIYIFLRKYIHLNEERLETTFPLSFFRNMTTALIAFHEIRQIEKSHQVIKLDYFNYFQNSQHIISSQNNVLERLENFSLKTLKSGFERVVEEPDLLDYLNELTYRKFDKQDIQNLARYPAIESSVPIYKNRNDLYEVAAAFSLLFKEYELVKGVPNDMALLKAFIKAK